MDTSNLITSTDVNAETSLREYSSLWSLSNGNMKLIKSRYDYDSERTLYQSILFSTKKDMLEFICDELDESVLAFIGSKRDKMEKVKRLIYLKRNDEERFYHEAMFIISAILDYYSINIQYKWADEPQEILLKEGIKKEEE